MTTQTEADLESAGANESSKNMKIVFRYLRKNLGTPYKILSNYPSDNPDPVCLFETDFKNVVEPYSRYCEADFFETHKAYLLIANKKLSELASYKSYDSVAGIIETLGKPSSEIIKQMEEEQKPILCVSDYTIQQACLLIYARTLSTLTKKYWEELPNGEDLKTKADNHFEDLCANSKIPRRTSTIIKRKKELAQKEIDALNKHYEEKSNTIENDN